MKARGVIGLLLAMSAMWAMSTSMAAAQPPPISAAPAAPAAPEAPIYVAEPQRFEQAPVLDGKLDDPVWQQGFLLTDFVQYEPNPGKPATERTEIHVGYDTHNLYFGIRCYDSESGKVVSKVRNRDGDLSFEDSVRIFLDTFRTRSNAYLFSVNAIGAKVDGEVRRQGEDVNYEWDGLWDVATSWDAEGWTAEVVIPFKTLRFPTAEPQNWGFDVQRLIPRKQEDSWWKPVPRGNGTFGRYRVSEYGELRGLAGITSAGRFQAVPYSLARSDSPDQRDRSRTGELGGDLKVSLASNLVLDLTANTDFAEAESDLQQINLSRFKLFYPEKRAFFLEGANLYYFGDRGEKFGDTDRFYFFYSRQIGLSEDGLHEIPVLGGAKLSGDARGVGIGFLNLTTDGESFRDSRGAIVAEPRTNYSVLRLKKSIFGQSTIGLIGLNKDRAGEDFNRGFGADWNLAFTRRLSSAGFITKTDSPGSGGDDTASSIDLLYRGDKMRARTVYVDVGDDFDPQMGFVTRTGIKRSQSLLGFFFFPDWMHIHRSNFINNFAHITDQRGRLQSQTWKTELTLVLDNSSGVALLSTDDVEVLDLPFLIHKGVVIPPGTYRFRNYFVGLGSDFSKPLAVTLWYDVGDYYGGRRLHTLVAPLYRPLAGLEIAGQWERNRIELPQGDFTTDVSWVQVSYAYSPTLTGRTLVQWNREDNLRADLVLDWTFRPGSDLFLIYKGTRDLDPLRRDTGFSPLDPGRSLTAKVRYRVDF